MLQECDIVIHNFLRLLSIYSYKMLAVFPVSVYLLAPTPLLSLPTSLPALITTVCPSYL